MAVEYIPCSFPYFPIPYGCWCGITIPYPPAHEEPIDQFDAKCKTHDICYEESLAEVKKVVWLKSSTFKVMHIKSDSSFELSRKR